MKIVRVHQSSLANFHSSYTYDWIVWLKRIHENCTIHFRKWHRIHYPLTNLAPTELTNSSNFSFWYTYNIKVSIEIHVISSNDINWRIYLHSCVRYFESRLSINWGIFHRTLFMRSIEMCVYFDLVFALFKCHTLYSMVLFVNLNRPLFAIYARVRSSD